MQYRQLGSSGARVSVIGLGTNRFGTPALPQEKVKEILDAALDLGINLIDTANGYTSGRSEETIGKAVLGRRSRFFIASKVFFPVGEGPNDRGASRAHIMNAIEDSLRRLQTDYLDLYYIHRWDETTPIEETLRTLDDLIRGGKVRYLGASDFASWQLAHANLLAEMRGWESFVVLQSHYNMLVREVEREVLPYCKAFGVGFIPYFPLAGGFLTGKYRQGEPVPPGSRGESSPYVQGFMNEVNFSKISQLEKWANHHGHGLNELAQAWLMAQPQVCSVISGATKIDHVLENVKAAYWDLSPSQLKEISSILQPDQP